jgi:hypothetical protein
MSWALIVFEKSYGGAGIWARLSKMARIGTDV